MGAWTTLAEKNVDLYVNHRGLWSASFGAASAFAVFGMIGIGVISRKMAQNDIDRRLGRRL